MISDPKHSDPQPILKATTLRLRDSDSEDSDSDPSILGGWDPSGWFSGDRRKPPFISHLYRP